MKAQKSDYLILGLFVVILIVFYASGVLILRFMPILETCSDDFAIISKCACIPCSWHNALEYNGKFGCLNKTLKNG